MRIRVEGSADDGAPFVEEFEDEGPSTILELGEARAGTNAARARELEDLFRRIAGHLDDAALDPRDRHELADAVDAAWFALAHPGAKSGTRAAMAFVEAVEAAAEVKRLGELRRAVAREAAGWKPTEIDERALRFESAKRVDAARAALKEEPALAHDWCLYADYHPIEIGWDVFGAAHARTAGRITRRQWSEAIEAWLRGPKGPRDGKSGEKWEVLARILKNVGAWSASASQLKSQWKAWTESRGIRSPLNRLRQRLQAAPHEQGSERTAKQQL